MKTAIYAAAFLLIMSGYSYAQRIKVSDYKVPVSQARTLRFDGNWNWSQAGDSVTSNTARGNMSYRQFFSSLPLAWFLNVDATGQKSFANYTHNVAVDGSFRKYIWQNLDWFGYTRMTVRHANFYRQIASDLTVGYGFGRYINATALAKAVRIEDHLKKDKILYEDLSQSAMIAIANIIEREDEYKIKYGNTYETYWFNDIEHEIIKSLDDDEFTMGSLGALRMRQVLFGINERVNERSYGFDLAAGFLFPLSSYDKKPVGNPNVTLNGRYSVPVDWQTQVNFAADFSTPLDSNFVKSYQVRAGIDFIYELSNRVNFVSSYRYSKITENSLRYITDHNFSASFWYYIENNVYFTINFGLAKQKATPAQLTSSVGLQYNLF